MLDSGRQFSPEAEPRKGISRWTTSPKNNILQFSKLITFGLFVLLPSISKIWLTSSLISYFLERQALWLIRRHDALQLYWDVQSSINLYFFPHKKRHFPFPPHNMPFPECLLTWPQKVHGLHHENACCVRSILKNGSCPLPLAPHRPFSAALSLSTHPQPPQRPRYLIGWHGVHACMRAHIDHSAFHARAFAGGACVCIRAQIVLVCEWVDFPIRLFLVAIFPLNEVFLGFLGQKGEHLCESPTGQ